MQKDNLKNKIVVIIITIIALIATAVTITFIVNNRNNNNIDNPNTEVKNPEDLINESDAPQKMPEETEEI